VGDNYKEFQDNLEQNLTTPAGGSAGDKQEHDPMLKKMAEALGLKIEDGAKDEDVQAAVTKAFAERDHEIAILKANMTAEEKAHHDTLADEAAKAEFRKLDTAARKAVIAKANELPEHVRKALAEADALKKRFADLEEKDALAAVTKRVMDAGLPDSEVDTFGKCFKADPEAAEKMLKLGAAGWKAADAAGTF